MMKNYRLLVYSILINTLIFIGVFLFLGDRAEAQRLQDNFRQSEYSYVFRLDTVAAEAFYKRRAIIDSMKYFNNRIDSFLYNKSYDYSKLPAGNYLTINSVDQILSWQEYSKPVFRINALGANNRLLIYVSTLNGERIENAHLRMISDGHIIQFDSILGAYPIQIDIKRAPSQPFEFLVIHENDFQFAAYSFNSVPRVRKSWKWWKRNQGIYENNYVYPVFLPGYLVFNQPKFRQGDTLQWKAFLVKPNGRPYRKPVNILIRNNSGYQSGLHTGIEPQTPGAYFGKWFLNDSLQNDQDYFLDIYSKKGQLLKSESFRIENYELRKNYFESSLEKTVYFSGEKILFRLKSLDVNNLPLLDTRVKVLVSLNQLEDFFTDTLFIPFGWNQKFWDYEGLADPSGISLIEIPDNLLPNARMRFNALVTFKTPEGEEKIFNHSFTYDPTAERYILNIKGDSMIGTYLLGSKSQADTVLLQAYNGNLLYEKEVILPFSQKNDEFPNEYRLIKKDKVLCQLYPDDAIVNSVDFEGERIWDSLNIKLLNPVGLKINFRIYEESKQIEHGRGYNFKLKKFLPGNKSVHVIYSFRWKGLDYIRERSFHTREKNLKVELNQPEIVYPGQKIPITIKVKDYKGNLRKNVNLAAFAVNSQFGELKWPQLPDFGKGKSGLLSVFQPIDMRFYLIGSKAINPFYFKLLKLKNNPYYQLVSDSSGRGSVYEDIEDEQPEFTPYVMRNNQSKTIYAVYINHKPIYLLTTNLMESISIPVSAGTFDIDVRTYDRMIKIKNVEFRKGKKLFLCINEDMLKNSAGVSFVNMDAPLTESEIKRIQPSILFFKPQFSRKASNYYLVQKHLVVSASLFNFYDLCSNQDAYYSAGPFQPGLIQLVWPGGDTLEFYFEPSSAYIFTDSTVLAVDPESKKIFLNFPKANFSALNNSFVLTHRKTKIPIIQQAPVLQAVVAPKIVRNHPALVDYINSWSQNKFSHLSIKNETGKGIKSVWMFYKPDETFSRIQFSGNLWQTYLKPGKYELIIRFADDSLSIFPDFLIKADGTNYRRINRSDIVAPDSILIAAAEDRIVKLNLPPCRKFENPPIVLNDVIKLEKTGNNETQISGFLFDISGKALDMVTVFIEEAGVFVAGAITNQMGFFKISPLKTGIFQVKIFLNGQFFTWFPLVAKNGKNTELKFFLPNTIGIAYDWNREVVVTAERQNISGSYSASYASPISYDSGTISTMESLISIGSFSLGRLTNLVNKYKSAPEPPPGSLTTSDNKNSMKEMMLKIKADTSLKKIRTRFRDFAYFIPNLLTDRNGEAHFTVVFPDNQTSWQTFVPAMDYHKRTGLGSCVTRSYKPLSASLALPAFLVLSDSIRVIGKVLNYSGSDYSIHSKFNINNLTVSEKNQTVHDYITDYYWFSPKESGEFKMSYSFKTSDNYNDGEERNLNVLQNGIPVAKGKFFETPNDTSFVIQAEPNAERRKLVVFNNRVDRVIELIQKLKSYDYGCNEQKASKLRALLYEKTILQVLAKPFTAEKEIRQLIADLEKSQMQNGAWGWWPSSPAPDIWMTCYIVESLQLALKSGYRARGQITAASYLKNHLNALSISERLYALQLLAGFSFDTDFASEIRFFDDKSISLQDSFRLIKIKQSLGMSYSSEPVLKAMKSDKTSNYWGEEVLDFTVNILPVSALAYQILSNDSSTKPELLSKCQSYFFNRINDSGNTLDQAMILQSVIADIQQENQIAKKLTVRLNVNNKEVGLNEFPYVLSFSGNEALNVQKKGAPLSFSVYSYSTNSKPAITDSLFVLNSKFEMNGKANDTLQTGKKVNYVVKLKNKRKAEFVKLEIPIPSTCIFESKPAPSGYEDSREYFDDRMVVFYRNLPVGELEIRLNLVPRFIGSSLVLPVQASLMYFPDHCGNSVMTKVWVKE